MDSTASEPTREIVFVDSRVKDAGALTQGMKPGVEIIYLRPGEDGLAQMAAALGERGDVGAVHVLAHGSEGELWLGGTFLDQAALERPDIQAALAAIGRGLTADGDMLIYACDTGRGDAGAQFVASLAAFTHADLAASDDRTGARGDWTLEISTGSIEHAAVLLPQAETAYQYDLATITVTSNADTGAGTLRNQIATATAGDTITFSGAMTVGLTSQLVINKNLTIDGDLNNDGVADVTLDAIYRSRVLQVQAGSNVMLDGLVITRGLVSGDGGDAGSGLAAANAFGGGIWNAGTLTLLNTSVTANAAAGGGGGGGNFAYDGGGGGGGGALGGGSGGRGGESGVSDNPGGSGSANQGGHGGAAPAFPGMGGQGGTGVGGAGGSYLGYSTGGTGGTATNGSISIGGGGGGLGTDATGGAGGSAAGGIYSAVGGIINVIGNSIISNNLGAGGGGGGGGAGGSLGNQNGGAGGRGIGAVWNKGTFNITAANNAAMTSNGAGSGAGGQELGTGSPGPSPAAVTGIYNDGGALNTSYVPNAPPVLGALHGDSVTFTEGDSARLIDLGSNATVSDGDSADYNGGSVRVSITANRVTAEDLLSIRNQGTGAGQIGVSGSNITYGGVSIGAFTGGSGSNDLVITINSASATPAAVEALLHNLVYINSNVDNPTASARTLSVIVYDGDSYTTTTNNVTVTVVAVNDAPTVSIPASLTATEDIATAITGISFADTDAGSASVTVILSVGSGTLSAISGGGVTIGGTASALALSGSIANINAFITGGAVSFVGAANSAASVTLTVGIDDGGHSGGAAQTGSGTVTIAITPVNDAPHVSAPPSIAVTEDVTTALSGISFSDVDAGSGTVSVQFSVAPGSGALSATGVSGVTVLGSGTGTLSLSGALSDINAFVTGGAVSFTTVANATGNVVLDVTIDDGGNTGSGGSQTDHTTITLAVTAVNDAPVNSVPGTQSVLQDGTLVFSSGNGNALSIADVDVGGGTIRVTLTASNGLLTLGSLSGVSFLVGNGTGDGTMVFEGNLSAINNALAGLSFAPTGGYYGPASVQITTDDLGQSGSGGGQTDTDTILINVAEPNPSITGVAGASPDGIYKAGDPVNITVTLDQAVTVSGGTPTLLLETGAVDRNAVYVSGSGTATLTFSYVVQAGDASGDLEYAGSSALSLHGATVTSVSLGNPAVLTLPTVGGSASLAGQSALIIDGVAPSVTSVDVPANATYTLGQVMNFTVHFGEAVTVNTAGGAPRLAIALDLGGTAYASYLGGSGTTALSFQLTVAAGQVDMTGIVVSALQANGAVLSDAAGNNAALVLANVAPTNGVRVNAPAPEPEPETPATPPTTPPTPPTPGVPDNDGIPPTVEDQTPGIPGPGGNTTPGDGNGDGIKDSEQPSVGSVGFVLSPTGASNPGSAPPTFTTLVASSQNGKVASGNDNSRITSLIQKDAPANAPAGLQTPIGLVSFTVELAPGKSSESFSLYLDPALGVNGYWKQDASGTWVNLASEPYGGKMVMEGGRVRLDFQITDGGQFDADGKVDGIITDPGAPGHMALSIVGLAPDMGHQPFWF